MQFNKGKRAQLILGLFVIVIVATEVHAMEGGGAAEGEKEGGKASGALPKDQKEYYEKTSKLTTLANRIVDSEKQFAEIVHKKSMAKTQGEKQAYIQEMLAITKKRNEDVAAFNKLKAEVAMRYPSQGQVLNRRYHTQSKRSVEELEGVASLDEMLSHTKKMIDKKYAPFADKDDDTVKKGTQPKSPASESAAGAHDEEEEPRLRLEK